MGHALYNVYHGMHLSAFLPAALNNATHKTFTIAFFKLMSYLPWVNELTGAENICDYELLSIV